MTRPKRPLKLVLSVIVQLVIFITVLLAFERWLLSTNEKPRLSAAQLAPITAQLSPDEFSRFASGEPLLVYVWATWCSICSVSSANVSDYGADHLSATVAVQSGTDLEIRQFIQDRGYQFQAYNDRAGHWFNSVGASVTPTYLWISLSGEILHLSRGYTSSVGLTGRRLILADQNTD
ncbi:redoxin family protein [Umboniibacter marinipuniceus]|uniref:Redoxin n=1 Tax=Umboniibacter marinipuniceus TaxID=569599 RepID=A0A3M0A291_9GAMM|nr:redoxin family protein [Umboniibacter marinipuniceus]RMA78767.1 redoxin [Umboniibacter marinipuniceus]